MRQTKNNISNFKLYISNMEFKSQKSARLNIFEKQRFLKFFTNYVQGAKCFNHLVETIIDNKVEILGKLKMLMGLHHVLMGNYCYSDTVLNYSFQLLDVFENKVISNGRQSLLRNIYLIYVKYILKICSNYENYIQIKSLTNHDQIQSQQKTILIYQIINLLRSALSFKDVFIGIGRYHIQQIPLTIDIYETIIKDISIIYNSLSSLVQPMIDLSGIKHEKQLSNIVNQISIMYDDLFIVIYNRYFSDKINIPSIKWIKTDDSLTKNHQRKSSSSSTKRIGSTLQFIQNFDLSTFQDTYFSKRSIGDGQQIQA